MADRSYKLTLSLSDGSTINAGTITAPQGPNGANGVTFTPSVSAAGVLSWTNNGGLTNPSPISIKGPKGDDAVITESDVKGWGFTKNKGTITEIKMNGESKGINGVVDLGTVLTDASKFATTSDIPDISGKQDALSTAQMAAANSGITAEKVTKYDGYENTINGKQAAITASNKLSASLVSGLATVATSGSYNDLSNIPIINQDLTASGFTPVTNTYYKHTGTTTDLYTNGVIYFYNGTKYAALDGSGSGGGKTYVYYVTGDGEHTSYDIKHPFGADVNVSVYLTKQSIFGETMDELVMVDVYTKLNKVKLVFASAPSSDMKFKVVITGVEPEKIGTLEETSWEKIREIILAGNAADYWSVGDTKTVKIRGLSYTARLADLQDGRYEYSDGSGSSKAVFELLELYNNQTMSDFKIKTGSTSNGGWATSFLKKTVLDNWAWNNLTDDLKNVISKVKVLSSVGGGTNWNETSSSDNRLFIPAVIELFDSPNGSLGLQESPLGQFDYYKTNNTNEARKKAPNNTTGTTQYWTRSPFTLGSDSFCNVEGDGSVTARSVSYELGAAIIFAI